jgi:hypothetical protein
MGKFSPVPEWVGNVADVMSNPAFRGASLEAIKHNEIVRVIDLGFAQGKGVASSSSSKSFRIVGRKAEKCGVVLGA